MKNEESFLPFVITGLAILAIAVMVNKLLLEMVNEYVAQTITFLLVSLFFFLYFWWKSGSADASKKPSASGLFAGEAPLWMTFWGVFQVGNNLLLLLTTLALTAGGAVPSPATLALATLALFCYTLVAAVAVWKSAARYEGPPLWILGARVMVLCVTLYSLASCVALFSA